MNSKIILKIDTTRTDQTRLDLIAGKKQYSKDVTSGQLKSQAVLPLLNGLLNEAKIKINEITDIEVSPGPGSFTGVRVGYTVAQVLAKLLNIPVNGVTPENLPPPVYIDSKYD